MMKYTVIGIYADTYQPWMTAVDADDENEAASEAVREMADASDIEPEEIGVVEVIEGSHDGILGNNEVWWGDSILGWMNRRA